MERSIRNNQRSNIFCSQRVGILTTNINTLKKKIMSDTIYTVPELKVIQIAMVCHQANKAWCDAHGDTTQKNWDEAEGWQRQSAINGVIFRIGNPDKGHDAQHNAWLEDKKKDGWVYGDVKDTEAKTHPCMVEFDLLPDFQKKKDALFCAIVDALSQGKTLTLESLKK